MWELLPPLHGGRVTLVKKLMRFLFQPHWHTFDLSVRKPPSPRLTTQNQQLFSIHKH